jgi:hypothetical protein
LHRGSTVAEAAGGLDVVSDAVGDLEGADATGACELPEHPPARKAATRAKERARHLTTLGFTCPAG